MTMKRYIIVAVAAILASALTSSAQTAEPKFQRYNRWMVGGEFVQNSNGYLGSGYQTNRKSLIFKDLRFFFWFLHHICTTGVWWIAGFFAGHLVHFYQKTDLGTLFFQGIKSSFGIFLHYVNHRPPSHHVLLAIQSFNW